MDDKDTKEKNESFSSFFFKGSVYVLALGFLFTLGESMSLSYTYLNTFSYVDFLLKAVLVIPLVFFLAFALSVFSQFIILPLKAMFRVREAGKNDGRSTKEKYLSLINAITWLLALILFPVFALVPIIKPNHALESLAFIFILILILLYIEGKTKQYSVKEEMKFSSKLKGRVGDVFEIQKFIVMCLLSFASGSAYIKLQNTDQPNAFILFKGSQKEIGVTILTSNSNVLAVSRDNYLEIIPRNEVKIIRYSKKLRNEKS